MNEEFKNIEIISEIRTLVDMAEEVKSDIDDYCAFMKEMFLGCSGVNQHKESSAIYCIAFIDAYTV